MLKKILFLGLIFNTLLVQSQTERFPFYEYAKRYNFGDFMPKDQGGKFVQVEILHTEDDAYIVQKIRDGILEEVYGTPIGWSKFEKTEIEKSVWVNRFYYLPSFARMYYLTKDKSYVDDMMRIVRQWVGANPKLPGSERATFNWRDMQVAWRAIHLSWCYYLTLDALSDNDKEVIVDLQKKHIDVLLLWFGRQKLNDFNHQSHGALAMLYLACLFPELDTEKQLQPDAMRILTHHINHAHYNDGGNVEQMFGYYPFQMEIFRDVYLLCRQNNIEMPDNLLPMLHKMATFMSDFAQPDQTMPAVNDSYPMDVLPSLTVLSELLNENFTKKSAKSAYYPDTQISVMRSGKGEKQWYVLLNPAMRIGSHAHAGRLAFNIWYAGKPIFVDAGCCNYDKRIKNQWYRTTKAHNTALIDGISDAESSSGVEYAKMRYTENRITEWIDTDEYKFCRMVSPGNDPTNNNVTWNRNIALVGDEFVLLHDQFEAKGKHTYDILYHLPPVEANVCSATKTVKTYRDSLITVIPATPFALKDIAVSNEYMYVDGEDYKAPMLTYSYKHDGELNSVFLIMPRVKNLSAIKTKQEVNSQGIGITLTKEDGSSMLLLIKNAGADELKIGKHKTNRAFEVIKL